MKKKSPVRADVPWTKRQEIPDPQVLDAADQYERARRILDEQACRILATQPLQPSVLAPLMNVAAMAIELYLKCLSAEVIHVKCEQGSAVYRVYAAPAVTGTKGHGLVELLDVMPDDIRITLDAEFDRELTAALGSDLRSVLRSLDGVFMASRYPFEHDMDICQYNFQHLMALSEFLGRFARSTPRRSKITW